jgi:hypothetical protein
MSRQPQVRKLATKKNRPLPPKRAPRPALRPQPRVMPKQHRGGR